MTPIGGGRRSRKVVAAVLESRTEQLLSAARSRISSTESLARLGSWELDVVTGAVTWSAGMFALWGHEPGGFAGDIAAATRNIHPDDRSAVRSALDACADTGTAIDLRYRITRENDAALRWIEARGKAAYAEGRVLRIEVVAIDVTEQVLAEKRALVELKFQQAVVDASPDVISVWDPTSGVVLWTNRSIHQVLGYTDLEFEALGGRLHDVVLQEDRPAAAAAQAAICDAPGDEVIRIDYRMRRRDGTVRWFAQRVAPLLRDAQGRVTQLIGVLRDTTEEMAIQSALRDSETLFQQLTDSLDVVLLIRGWDPSEFLYVSPGYVKIFGYDPMLLKETPEESLRRLHPEDRDRFRRDYWAKSATGSAASIEYRIVRLDGEVRWLRASTTPVAYQPGARRRSASIVEDITASRRAEAALIAARDAAKASTATNEFFSRMSHELRTPMNAVLGFAQLLELDTLTTDQQEFVQQILRGGAHMVELIDDVLDISKIESDSLEMFIESVPIDEFLTKTVSMMLVQARVAQVSLKYLPNPGAGLVAQADHHRLRQVLLNLLSNAIKYNHPGGQIEVSCTAVEHAMLDIQVRDSGRGIREDVMSQLFTPFERLGVEETGIEGTGVGLALSRGLMAVMGGTLTATSRAGLGSTFTASIPSATRV